MLTRFESCLRRSGRHSAWAVAAGDAGIGTPPTCQFALVQILVDPLMADGALSFSARRSRTCSGPHAPVAGQLPRDRRLVYPELSGSLRPVPACLTIGVYLASLLLGELRAAFHLCSFDLAG